MDLAEDLVFEMWHRCRGLERVRTRGRGTDFDWLTRLGFGNTVKGRNEVTGGFVGDVATL